jgi:general secretion pathway protein B
MSFILDALKKSEIERQRQSVPGLMDTRLSPRRNRLPLWAAALGVLLAINLLALTYVLVRKSFATAPASRAANERPVDAPPVPQGRAAPPEAQPFSPLDGAPEYAPEIPVAPPTEVAHLEPRQARRAPAGDATAVHRSEPLSTDADANAETEEVLPSMNEISLSGAQALPELHLDVHVYATRPAERFVYINMRKYHEGAKLQEGPTVERIRRDGVVLNYQGVRFLLSRQP